MKTEDKWDCMTAKWRSSRTESNTLGKEETETEK
jgi:hypothetical protein